MTITKQRVVALTFHHAIQMLAAPTALEEIRHAAGDSDPSVKLYHVTTILAALLNGMSTPPGDPKMFQWIQELNRAIFFARGLRNEMEQDSECAPQVRGLTCESTPTNLPTRIYVVLAIAERELGAELERIEDQCPKELAEFLAASRAAFDQLGAFVAPKESA
jgi:hypothetical protein